MSVSSNSIDRFLNFALKIRNRKFNPTGICDEGDGLTAVNKLKKNKKNVDLNIFFINPKKR